MKIDIRNSYEFIEYMRKYNYTDKFSNEGLHALYDWFEELYTDEDRYTVTADELAIYYTEYESVDEYLKEYYDDEEIKEFKTVTYEGKEARLLTYDEIIEKISEVTAVIPFTYHYDYKDQYRIIVFNH